MKVEMLEKKNESHSVIEIFLIEINPFSPARIFSDKQIFG